MTVATYMGTDTIEVDLDAEAQQVKQALAKRSYGCPDWVAQRLVEEWFEAKQHLLPIFGDDLEIRSDTEATDDDIRLLLKRADFHHVLDYCDPAEIVNGYKDTGNGNAMKLGKYLTSQGFMACDVDRLAMVRQQVELAQTSIVVSIRPVDILASSEFACFRSCHSWDGEHASGPVSLAIDPHTAVAYAYQEHRNGMPHKLWRQMVSFPVMPSQSGLGMALFFKQYQQENSVLYRTVRFLVMRAMREAMGLPNHISDSTCAWTFAQGASVNLDKRGYKGYFDSHDRATVAEMSSGKEQAYVNLPPPICLACGNIHSHSSLYCECGGGYACGWCGDFTETEAASLSLDGWMICPDCVAESAESCPSCGFVCHSSRMELVDGKRICPSCVANAESCHTCGRLTYSQSDRLILTSDGMDSFVCNDCVSLISECQVHSCPRKILISDSNREEGLLVCSRCSGDWGRCNECQTPQLNHIRCCSRDDHVIDWSQTTNDSNVGWATYRIIA